MAKEENRLESLNVVSSEPIDFTDEVTDRTGNKKPEEKEEATSGENEESKSTDNKKEENEEEAPPAPPKRPVSPITKLKEELKSAFPDTDDKIITAILVASQGVLDPAFNALLYLSDPTFEPEIPDVTVSEQRQIRSQPVGNNASTTDDELLARQLQKEFEEENRRRRRRNHEAQKESRNRPHEYDDDSPDEFGQIKETFSQGLEEARTTLNGWVSGIAKKFSENDNPSKQNPKLFGALGGSSFNAKKTSKFDEDPEIIDNDFHKINLSNNTESSPPALPSRKPNQSSGTEIEPVSDQSDTFSQARKWQPLNSDVPVDSDAFLVTDSEDEDHPAQTEETPKKIATENSTTK